MQLNRMIQQLIETDKIYKTSGERSGALIRVFNDRHLYQGSIPLLAITNASVLIEPHGGGQHPLLWKTSEKRFVKTYVIISHQVLRHREKLLAKNGCPFPHSYATRVAPLH